VRGLQVRGRRTRPARNPFNPLPKSV